MLFPFLSVSLYVIFYATLQHSRSIESLPQKASGASSFCRSRPGLSALEGRSQSSRHDKIMASTTSPHTDPQHNGNTTTTASSNQHSRQTISSVAPLYITIGPQCCGKSTFLKKLDGGKVKDISIDDQPDVYVSVPTAAFFCVGDTKVSSETRALLEQIFQGRSLRERILNDNEELRLILRRWNNDLNPNQFDHAIKTFYAQRQLPSNVGELLVTVVENFLNNDGTMRTLPESIDVFILESLFKPHPKTKQSAIQRAHEELRMTPKHVPIAWGNTNSKSRDYMQALEIACQSRRPVRFVLCHPTRACKQDEGGTASGPKLLKLPWIDFSELLLRNLKRLHATGRYIPAFAIADCCHRVEDLVPQDVTNVEGHLVSLTSPPCTNKNKGPHHPFQYVLTKKRLIQKVYLGTN